MRARWAIFVSMLGLVAATAYGVYLGITHQSNPNDRALMVVFALFAGLVCGTACAVPSWIAWRYMLQSRSSAKRLALFLGSVVLPVALLVWWSIYQWADWDEFAVAWIAVLPTLAAALWCYRSAESQHSGD